MIYRKKRPSQQPQGPVQIDWSNPLTAELTDWIDLRPLIARSALPTGKNVTSQASAITGSAGQGGIGLRFPGGATDGKLTVGGNADYTQANQTWVVICSARATATSGVNANVLLSKSDTSTSFNGYTFFCDSTSVALERKGNANPSTVRTLAFNVLNFPVSTLGFSFDNSFFRVSANGRISTDATSPATTFTTSQPLNIGDSVDAFWESFDGVIYAVFGWVGKTLTPTQLAEVTRNPWQLFAPQTKPLFFSTQGTAGQTLTPSLFTNSNTFYSATVTAGAVTLTPGLYTNTNTFYSATVTPGAVTLTPDLFTNTNSFYSPTVTAGAVTLTPDLFTNTNSFYSATVTSTVTLTPDLYTNGQTFYAPTVTQGAAAQTLAPDLFTNTNVFYNPTVAPGTVTLTPDLYQNTNAFYSPTVVQATEQTILPDLFVNTNEFYRAVVDDGIRRASQDATPGYATPRARYRVRVGSRWMEVDPLDPMSVRRAYDAAQEDAQDAATQDIEAPAAVAAQAVVVQPIKGPDYTGLAKEARRISEDIRKVYADALQTALIARLMREQIERDDEDDIAVLLASI